MQNKVATMHTILLTTETCMTSQEVELESTTRTFSLVCSSHIHILWSDIYLPTPYAHTGTH